MKKYFQKIMLSVFILFFLLAPISPALEKNKIKIQPQKIKAITEVEAIQTAEATTDATINFNITKQEIN